MGKQQKLHNLNKRTEESNEKANRDLNSQNLKAKKIQKRGLDNKQNSNNNSKTNKQPSKSKQMQQNTTKNKQNLERKVQVDERFARASYDPKFLRPKRQITKVKVDSRFSKMLTDPAFQNLNKVDKYGRKIQQSQGKNKKQNQELRQFYTYEDQQQESQQQPSEQMQSQEQKGQGQIHQQQNDQQQVQIQGGKNMRKWMQEYDQQSSSLGQMPIDELVEQQNQGAQVWSDDDQNVIRNQSVKATKRLALCNFDWMNITSKDLMILFNSFKPAAGFIKSIKVYQSLLGKQKMEQQQVFGPQGIWNDEQLENFQEQEPKKGKKARKSWKQLLNRQDSSALDSRKLRAYQKERLKYFYAVIECDSRKTADEIYKQCDGNHFQNSNLQFDLRFIPGDITFDTTMLKEQCNQMPVTGQVKNFVNRAMGHSKVELTWQDPQLSLAAGLKKKNWGKMTDQELNKIDWSTYLNEEDLEDQENKQELFQDKDDKDIMPDWKVQCNKKYRREMQAEKLVISFDSGFSSAKPAQKINTEAPSLKKQKKSKKQLRIRAQEERKKRRDDLALITQNAQQQKQKNFKVNVQDQRFKAVYSNPLFSIDPSNPKFDHKKTGNVFKQVVQRNRNKKLQ